MVRRFLRESGREVQTDDPENARLVLHRSMGGKERERVSNIGRINCIPKRFMP